MAGLKEELTRVLDLDLPVDEWAKEEGIADEELLARIDAARRRAHGRQGRAMGPGRHALGREVDPAADARPSLARASRHARASAPGDRPARLRPARSAQRVQGRGLQLFEAMSQSLREAVTAQLMRVEIVQAAAGSSAPSLPYMEAHTSIRRPARTSWRWRRPARATLAPRAATRERRRGRAQSERSDDLGQGRPQRGLPVRLRQEVQALPRAVRVRPTIARRIRRIPNKIGRACPAIFVNSADARLAEA